MSAVKALQQWCRIQCEGYRDVSITNMTTSFRDGLAFCALIHKHRPDLINFDSLKKEDVYDNNKLAFKVAEEQLGIPALLDAEDMVALRVPDRLSILTYVSQYYNYFHGRSPIGGMAGIKRPAEGTNDEPSGKKNQAVTAKVFPGSKPSRENSPPRSANVTKPSPSPKQIRNSTQEHHVEKSQAGTLSNKCVLCNKHVHLVQRQLVEGKLYHRNCARGGAVWIIVQTANLKSLSTNTSSLFRDLPTNTHISKFSPQTEPVKPATVAPAKTPSRLGPMWATEKPGSPPNGSSSFSASPVSAPASVVKETPKVPVSKPSTFTTGVSTNPTAAPRTSVTAAKTFESKMKFLQSDDSANHEEKKTSVFRTTVNKGQTTNGKGQDVLPGQTVTMVVNVKDVDKGGAAKTTAAGSKASTNAKEYDDKTRATAAAFISKKLPEENNNNSSKPSWTNVALRKTDKPLEETPKKTETGGVRGKVKLKADLSLLADLQTPEPDKSSAGRCGGADKTPDRGGLKPPQTSHNTSASENESPGAWRSKLKPISKEAKPAGLPQSSPKPYSNGATRTSEPSAGPPAVSAIISVSKESQNGPKEQIPNAAKSESKNAKTKPGYIPKEDMIRELKEIEENLNELERRGVELELRLRKSEEEGSDDDEDELMVEWFTLIRNKQVAMRRESELVYIGRTQDLEEEQPSVEQELRRLMDKPEHLKTFRDRQREKQLMDKLIEIVNDRNAIIEGLDEDRLREEEEDEELNKMMMNFNIKKDKIKRKSQKFRLFSWGSKKDA